MNEESWNHTHEESGYPFELEFPGGNGVFVDAMIVGPNAPRLTSVLIDDEHFTCHITGDSGETGILEVDVDAVQDGLWVPVTGVGISGGFVLGSGAADYVERGVSVVDVDLPLLPGNYTARNPVLRRLIINGTPYSGSFTFVGDGNLRFEDGGDGRVLVHAVAEQPEPCDINPIRRIEVYTRDGAVDTLFTTLVPIGGEISIAPKNESAPADNSSGSQRFRVSFLPENIVELKLI